MIDVVFGLGFAPSFVMAFEFQALGNRKRRNADAGETKMVRTIVVAGFGMGIGADGLIEKFGHGLDDRIEGGALCARDFDFFRFANRGQPIVIQIEGNFSRGYRGMRAQVFGTEQALFLGGDCGEQDRAAYGGLGVGPVAGEFQQDAAAGGVVDGSIVNIVALQFRNDAEMIVVGGVQYRFALELGVGARKHGDDVARDERPQFARDVRLQMYRQLYRFEVAGLRLGIEFVEIEAAHGREFLGYVELNPRRRLQFGSAVGP